MRSVLCAAGDIFYFHLHTPLYGLLMRGMTLSGIHIIEILPNSALKYPKMKIIIGSIS